MYLITNDTIKQLEETGELYINCTLGTLYHKKREINDFLFFQNKNWRVFIDSKNSCLRKIDGDGELSNEKALLILELIANGSVKFEHTHRNLRLSSRGINDYLERNNFDWRAKPDYDNNCIVMRKKRRYRFVYWSNLYQTEVFITSFDMNNAIKVFKSQKGSYVDIIKIEEVEENESNGAK